MTQNIQWAEVLDGLGQTVERVHAPNFTATALGEAGLPAIYFNEEQRLSVPLKSILRAYSYRMHFEYRGMSACFEIGSGGYRGEGRIYYLLSLNGVVYSEQESGITDDVDNFNQGVGNAVIMLINDTVQGERSLVFRPEMSKAIRRRLDWIIERGFGQGQGH